MRSRDDIEQMERKIKNILDASYSRYRVEKLSGNTVVADLIWDKMCFYNNDLSVLRWVLDDQLSDELSSHGEDLQY